MSRRASVIATIVFLVFLIPPITIGYFYYSLDQSLTSQAINKQQTFIGLTANAVRLKLDNLVTLATSIASVDSVSSDMAAQDWNGAAAAVRDLENNPVYYDSFIDRISIYDPQGIQQAAYPELQGAIGTRGASDAWYRPLVDGAGFYVDHVIQRLSIPQIKVVSIAVPVVRDHQNVGYLILQIPIANFLEFSVDPTLGSYGFTYIVDAQGYLVSDPQASENYGGLTNLSSVSLVQKVLAGQKNTMIIRSQADSVESLVSYQPIPVYGWGLITETPAEEAFAARNGILFLMMLGIIAALGIDLVLTYLAIRFFDDTSPSRQTLPRIGSHHRSRGFTLIELLVVIAIIAILSVVVILTLNPTELLRQSRDSNRIADLSTLKTAVSLYLSDATSPNLASSTSGYGACYISAIGANATTTAKCGAFANTYTSDATSTSLTYRNTNSAGWLPINFSQISYGSPLGTLPVDPLNNAVDYYSYAATSSGYSFEIDAFMESKKYSASGTNDVVSTDGGDNNNAYEVGTKSGLNL
jgi:general secretion pathway protein G